MSVSDRAPAGPSDWAVARFGDRAGELAAALPRQLGRAHARARDVHLAARLKKRSPYGSTLAEAARENFADTARELGGAVGLVRGYEYAVVNRHVLFPYKYADRPLPLHRARLPSDASPTRRRMLTAHGPEEQDALFELDDGLITDEHLRLHEAFEELGATARLVLVFFTADPENGVHAIHWGEARLETDRTFTWPYSEQLPAVAVGHGG